MVAWILPIVGFVNAGEPSPVLDNVWNYLPDVGSGFGDQPNGLQFGWSKDKTADALDSANPVSPDERYDSGVLLRADDEWEIALRNGWYRIALTVGATNKKEAYCQVDAEGTRLIEASDFPRQWPWLTRTADIRVRDGRLTVSAGPDVRNIFIAQLHLISSLSGRYDEPTIVSLPFRVNTGGPASTGYSADKPWVENSDHGFVVPQIIETRTRYFENLDFTNTEIDGPFQSLRSTAEAKIPLVYRVRTRPKTDCVVKIGFVNYGVAKARRLELSASANGNELLPRTEFHRDPGPNRVKIASGQVHSGVDGIIEVKVESHGTLYPHPPHLAFLSVDTRSDSPKPEEIVPSLPPQGESIKIDFGPRRTPVDLTKNRFLSASKRFADSMLLYGRNLNGEFYREVDLETKKGLKVGDPNVDQDVYRLFYLLSHVTDDPSYRAAADQGIRHFLRHRSGTGIITWAEGGSSVNCENDQFPVIHDDLWRLEPLRMLLAAHDYWENGIGNKETGDFDRHCSSTAVGVPFARHGGAMINLWMEAYKRTHDPQHLQRARLLTNFYNDLMKSNQYEYWTGPVEMVMLLGMGVNLNAFAILPDQPQRDFMLDFCRRNSQTQVANNVWSRRHLHAHAIMANRYYQLLDVGEAELASAFRDRFVALIRTQYADLDKSSITEQSKDVGAVILTCLAAYKITGDRELLTLAKSWADLGLTTFLTDMDLPPLVAGGSTYGRSSGGSNGGNTPSTLPLGQFLLGMEMERPNQRLLLINAPF
jgi:hypothetical protein